MRVLSRRALDELRALQMAMRRIAADRNAALRMFMVSRNAATPAAQREFWLEFSWIDQEYRVAVQRLASFCAVRSLSDQQDPRSSDAANSVVQMSDVQLTQDAFEA